MQDAFRTYLLALTEATACEQAEVIQSLWSGYGSIVRYRLEGGTQPTVVVKHIDLSGATDHPRGWNTDTSHHRKIQSYRVEVHWYRAWSRQCSDNCRVPMFLGSYTEGEQQWIVLEDLDRHFPVRKDDLNFEEALPCIQWLAAFHAQFMQVSPSGLWEVGSYWHLAARPDELQRMQHPTLKARAHDIDRSLYTAKFQTIIHGDAKLANFCFSEDGAEVAAVDFQYVGGGVGVKDLAYFLGSCFTGAECERWEEAALNAYFNALHAELDAIESQVNREALEQEWRKLYPYAIADFTRFLLGWMPEHHKVNDYHLNTTERLLQQL